METNLNESSSKIKTFYIETYGCAANKADSYIMEHLLRQSGYIRTDFKQAHFIIINTCGVKQQTENKIKARLKKLYKDSLSHPEKKFIIAGCLPFIAPNYLKKIQNIFPNYSAMIDLNSIEKIVEIFKLLENGSKNLLYISNKKIDKSKYKIKHPKDKITGIIPISEGCLGACTYCCVKNARGRLKCYNPQHIIKTIEVQLEQGIKQIYLTSQDCGIYEFNSTQLGDLIEKVNNLPFQFFLRIGMINPSFLIDNLQQLIKAFKLENVYQFLHVPIQSGSNKILRKMNRTYLIKDIIRPLYQLRKEFPYLTISTDIICGFPGESEYDFYKTINFIKWLRPEILNISQFTTRPGTKAKKMEQLDSKTIKNRSTRLSSLFRNNLNFMNQKWKDWQGKVLALHKTSTKNQVFGRNFAYKNVLIDNYTGSFGKFVDVKISKVDGFNLYGEIIEK
jgi:MiaB-like tRNA modifying enzyme